MSVWKKTWDEFIVFLKEYNVVALAIAFIMGAAAKDLVTSLVNNIIMPFVTPLIPQASWEDASFSLGPVVLRWGAFVAEALAFVILAFVVFLIAKKTLKEEKVTKK